MIRIENLHAENFKSFKAIDLDFSKLNVIIGANSAGKSNFVKIFKFIKDILMYGIDDAISLQGGMDYLYNFNSSKCENLRISFSWSIEELWIRSLRAIKINGESLKASLEKIECSFEIAPLKGKNYKIVADSMSFIFSLFTESLNDEPSIIDVIDITVERTKNSYKVSNILENNSEEIMLKATNIVDSLGMTYLCAYMKELKKELLLNRFFIVAPSFFHDESLINIYDFDPKKLKKTCSVISFTHLEEDGSNIAYILKTILRNKKNREKLIKLFNDILPNITNVSIQKGIDQSISYQVSETYSKGKIYSNFLSDGTVSIMAFIVALYFEQSSKIHLFEEPERNIHPKLLSKLVNMAKDVSENKQIFFTTHNAEILRNVDIKDIFLIQRDENGYSYVSKPCDSSSIRNFLDNEIGIGDLFLDGLLG